MKVFKDTNRGDTHILDEDSVQGSSYCGWYLTTRYNSISMSYDPIEDISVTEANGEHLCPECVGEAYSWGVIDIIDLYPNDKEG